MPPSTLELKWVATPTLTSIKDDQAVVVSNPHPKCRTSPTDRTSSENKGTNSEQAKEMRTKMITTTLTSSRTKKVEETSREGRNNKPINKPTWSRIP
jgi:hypothetical protein